MPWEIPIYICSRFAEALEQIYIPVGLFKQPPPLSLEKEICVWISCIHTNIVYIVYTYGYSIKTPPGGFRWKIEIFSSKIFLTKVLFLKTKTSEYYLDSNSASRKLIKLSNHGTDCFSQPAHRSRIYVGCSQLWHCSTSLHLSGAAQAAERRQGHGRRPCTHGCCSRYVGRCNQERALSPFFNSFCYGWQNPTCCRWNSFYWSYFSQHCKSFIDCYYSAQCNCWDVHCRTRS